MSGWDQYVNQIQHKLDPTTNTWVLTNICEFAAVYGLDGTPWAATAGFQLYNYTYPLQQEDGTTKDVPINEFTTVHEATKGNRKGSEAGIRMAN